MFMIALGHYGLYCVFFVVVPAVSSSYAKRDVIILGFLCHLCKSLLYDL